MEFKYKNEDTISIKTDQHNEITYSEFSRETYNPKTKGFSNQRHEILSIDGEIELERGTELNHGLFVSVGNKIVNLSEVWAEASNQFDEIMAEAEQERQEEEQYRDDVRFDYNWAIKI